MWKPPRPSPPRRNPSAIILYMRVCRVRSVLRPAPTHCQGLAKSLLYRPALWHSLCTLNSHSNSLRWVGEVRRLAVGSKRGLRETLTFCFGHERWCLCLMQGDFLSAVWSVLYYVVYYVMSLHSFMSALTKKLRFIKTKQAEKASYWRRSYELDAEENALSLCVYIFDTIFDHFPRGFEQCYCIPLFC